MRSTWHLATNNLAGRPLRTSLLVGAIVAAVTLMVAVASMLDTVDRTHERTLGSMFGLGQLRLVHRYHQRIDHKLVEQVKQWPGVEIASPRFEHHLSLRNLRTFNRVTVQAYGVDPALYGRVRPVKTLQGSMFTQTGEIVLDEQAAEIIKAEIGDTLEVIPFGEPTKLKLVGVLDRPRLGVLQRPLGLLHITQAQSLAGLPGWVDDIEIKLKSGVDPLEVLNQHESELTGMATLQTTAAASAGMSRGLEAARLMFALISALVYIAAGFIIAASLTTAVAERLRELAILRSVGATRLQVAIAQITSGAMLTAGGTIIGIPLGLAVAYSVYNYHRDRLPAGFDPAWTIVGLTLLASTIAGGAAAIYPAILAARVSPVEGLAARAKKPSAKGVVICLMLGLLMTLSPMLVFRLDVDNQIIFWFTALVGVPAVLVGFFLLSVPLVLLVNVVLHRPMGWLLRVPGPLLAQGVTATPYRSGFTAGALMISLALLVNIWMGGRSFMAGWFDQIRIPDVFIHSPTPISAQQLRQVKTLSYVMDTCSVTAFNVPTAGLTFGVKYLAPKQTLFVACDIHSFVSMANLLWVQGTPEEALKQMDEGKAVLVSQEFLAVHRVGLGHELTLQTQQGPQVFRVAGVVASPGIDVATQFYGIGKNYASASIGSIIGTNADAIEYWGIDSANLVLVSIDPKVNDRKAVLAIRKMMPGLLVSSARRIREQVHEAADKLMSIATAVAAMALVIGSLGVGNLILAGIHARRFEFGVLRAIGGRKFMLGRLIIGQTLIIALTGCVLGVVMGMQATSIGRHLYQSLLGVTYDLLIPWDMIGVGTAAVIVAAIGAAIPAVIQIVRAHPRTLLSSD